MIKIFCILIFITHLGAEEIVLPNPNEIEKEFERSKIEEYQITTQFKAGSNLIYNCRDEHYACVDKDGLNLCQDIRDMSIKKKSQNLGCVIIEKFEEKDKCILRNYELQNRKIKKKFCHLE